MLIVAFSLQLSWSVASAYCMHETDNSDRHFGHHPHQHHDAIADEGEDADQATDEVQKQEQPSPGKASSHPDCASCSSSPLAAYTWQTGLVTPLLLAFQATALQPALPGPYLGKPLRPKWIFAA